MTPGRIGYVSGSDALGLLGLDSHPFADDTPSSAGKEPVEGPGKRKKKGGWNRRKGKGKGKGSA